MRKARRPPDHHAAFVVKTPRVDDPDILVCDHFAARPVGIAAQMDVDGWIGSLPEPERQFTTLLLEGCTQKEAAMRCGLSVNATQPFVERLRRRLLADLPEYFGPRA